MMKLLKYFVLTSIILILLSQIAIAANAIADNKFELLTSEDIRKLNEIYVFIEKGNVSPSKEVVAKFYEEEKDLLGRLTSVYTAAEEGDFDVVKGFIEAGGNVNYPPYLVRQEPFVIYAIGKNDLEMVKYLVEKGADINYFVYMNRFMHKYLLDLRNLYIREDVFTPLLLAVAIAYHYQSLDIAEYLHSKGAKFPVEIGK